MDHPDSSSRRPWNTFVRHDHLNCPTSPSVSPKHLQSIKRANRIKTQDSAMHYVIGLQVDVTLGTGRCCLATTLTWVRLDWTWRYDTLVRHFMVECVGPCWYLVLYDRHRRIVGEVGVVEHLEHIITSNLSRSPQFVNWIKTYQASKTYPPLIINKLRNLI